MPYAYLWMVWAGQREAELGYGPKQHVHVPYRSSSLTRVLMECFVKV